METPDELRRTLTAAADALRLECRPVVMMTPWDIGPVSAYLFPSEPVTLIDAGVDTPEAWSALVETLDAAGLQPRDVEQVVVTHGHTDHFGCAVRLQDLSGCPVYMHRADIANTDPQAWPAMNRELFGPLGFTDEMIDALWGGAADDPMEWKIPRFTPVEDGAVLQAGRSRLRVEHHPGHSAGHIWAVDEGAGAIFVGDYVIADHPTNAGLEVDRSHRTGRAQLLEAYNAGLRELMTRNAPALFAGHGPPITDHRSVIGRRLEKTDRRSRHVLDALSPKPRTALEVGRSLYGARAERSWEMMADLVGRLDLLVTQGRATSDIGEDGIWYFAAQTPPPNQGDIDA